MMQLSLPAWGVVVAALLTLSLLASGQCPDGKFGRDCRYSCHCLNDSNCDAKSGACDKGCHGHYSGPSCQRRNVALGARVEMRESRFLPEQGDRPCTRITDGVKSTCCFLEGYYSSQTSLSISMNSTQILSHIVLSSNEREFPLISRRIEATSENGRCITMTLNRFDRSVTFSCDVPGRNLSFYLHVSVRILVLCEVEVFVCSKGFYSETCSLLCGHCKNDNCNQETGRCSDGCETGYAGNHCNETCGPGTFGQDCKDACGRCTNKKPCNHKDGMCSDGCEAGYTAGHCNETCAPATFGHNCSNVCGHCRYGKPCNHEDGTCSDGCEAGYMGNHCNKTCARETYGQDCSLQCPQCHSGMSCHHVTGSCPHVTGSCPQEAGRFGAGIGVGLAVALILAMLVLVATWLARKRGCRYQERPSPAPESTSASPVQEESYVVLDARTREAPNLYEEMRGTYENTGFSGAKSS